MPKVIDLPTATSMDSGDYFVMEESTGGTKKITRANALAANIVTASSSLTSVPSGSYTTLCSMSLTKGTWIVTGQIRITANANYEINAAISTSPSTGEAIEGGYVQMQATTGIPLIATTISRQITVSATSQTIYLIMRQYSGSAKATTEGQNNMKAVRIA